jgi:hypothetical protein
MTTTNVDTVGQLLKAVASGDRSAVLRFFTDDGVFDLPYLPGRGPKSFAGKDAIEAFLVEAGKAFTTLDFEAIEAHSADDGRVVVAEYEGVGQAATGREYRNRYVSVFTFDGDGRIARWREYSDPTVTMRALKPLES